MEGCCRQYLKQLTVWDRLVVDMHMLWGGCHPGVCWVPTRVRVHVGCCCGFGCGPATVPTHDGFHLGAGGRLRSNRVSWLLPLTGSTSAQERAAMMACMCSGQC